MMKVRDIIKVLEDFAPLSVQESWDNSGLAVGSPDADVSSVLIGRVMRRGHDSDTSSADIFRIEENIAA